MKIQLNPHFKKNLKGRFAKYNFQVGILEDAPHKEPKGKANLGSYAGGPIRKASRKNSGLMISDVSNAFMAYLGFNYLSEPFKKKNSDIIKFTKEFFNLAFGRSEKRRVENLLQAIVRNPILRSDYGNNSKITIKVKGFNRLGIDTAQLFKAILAECKVRNV